MKWSVVEVKPEPHHRLFVRFQDGVAGYVQFRPEELTGVLAPLLDEQFFAKAYIDFGGVSWSGEIDLAPDAMYGPARRTAKVWLKELHAPASVSPAVVVVRADASVLLRSWLCGQRTLS